MAFPFQRDSSAEDFLTLPQYLTYPPCQNARVMKKKFMFVQSPGSGARPGVFAPMAGLPRNKAAQRPTNSTPNPVAARTSTNSLNSTISNPKTPKIPSKVPNPLSRCVILAPQKKIGRRPERVWDWAGYICGVCATNARSRSGWRDLLDNPYRNFRKPGWNCMPRFEPGS